MKHTRWTALFFMLLALSVLAACSGSSEDSGPAASLDAAADTAKDAGEELADTAEEAMDEAKQAAEDLTGELADKEAELQKITDELKALSPADLAGDKAKDLKSRQDKLMEEIKALKEKIAG